MYCGIGPEMAMRRRNVAGPGRMVGGFCLLLTLLAGISAELPEVAGQDRLNREAEELTESMRWNWPWRTLGGKQFWTDQRIERDWRIQRNSSTGHYRLLDPQDVRRAWGSYEACSGKLDQVRREENWEPVRGRVLIALHGLGRSRSSMGDLCAFLRRESDEGLTVVNFGYASTREPLEIHAEALARVISHFPEAERIDFVAHSLGNLVIRRYFAGTGVGTHPTKDPRLGRIVMLGPPNQGAEIATRMQYVPLFKTVMGPSGKALASDWEELESRLAIPSIPFGIIAGGRGNDRGLNPLVTGDDDVVVRVEETRLPGARDFRVVPALHSFMMDDPDVKTLTRNFLDDGWFESEETREPIRRKSSREMDEQAE
jgi:pimeloyl-ACP methyl ester carboxylesterase